MRERHHRWQWRLRGTPAQLWPMVADTDRFDRDTGVPALERLPTPDPALAEGRVRARVRRLGIALDFEQLPFEWEAPSSFRVTRRFESGPLAELRVLVELRPDGDDHTLVDYQVWSVPSGVLGALAIPLQVGVVLAWSFERTMRRYAAAAARDEASVATARLPAMGVPARRRLQAAAASLRSDGLPVELVDALTDLIVGGDDLVVGRLRPFAVADGWGADRDQVLDLFLEATRAGIVRFRWDVLCPQCRIAKASVSSLALLPSSVHCDTCLIDYRADLAASIELTFRPTDQVRPVEVAEHCIGGPMTAPHVAVQAIVPPSGVVSLAGPLAPGRYRVRVGAAVRATLQSGARPAGDGGGAAEVGGIPSEVRLSMADGAVPELVVSEQQPLHLRCEDAVGGLLVIERPGWAVDAVTGTAVLARQRFRDLFAEEALRPGEQLDVGTVTIAFTDLCGSTAMYRSIGDAVAFGRVQAHFDLLRLCVADNHGAVVKTIGDAVMAVFPTPEAGVAAMQDALIGLRALEGAGGRLHLKAGVHTGPALAVTLNGRIDYFGTTVNLAARLQGLAGPDELILSTAVVDKTVAAMVGVVVGEPDEVIDDLRGLEGTPVGVHRVVVG